MISAEGKRLAGTFGLTVNAQNGVFFGAVGGYSVAVVENTSQRKYYITFPARPSQGAPDQAPGDFLHGFAAGRKLGWLWGTILAGLGRWVSLTLSGGLLWYMYMPEEFLGLPMVDPWVYSMIFNGVLIVLVTVVNLIVLGIFQSVPALRQKLLTKQN